MESEKTFTNTAFMKTFQYKDTEKLNTRLKTWKTYGSNKIDFHSWLVDVVLDGADFSNFGEVGCGTGEFASLVLHKKLPSHVTCIDISEGMVNAIRRKLLDQHGYAATCLVGDVQHLPLDDDVFSFCAAKHIFHHVDDIETGLEELRRVTRHKGTIIITTAEIRFDEGLNKLHYEGVMKANMPQFMLNKQYTNFLGDTAVRAVKSVFTSVEQLQFSNDLVFPETEAAMQYYESAMMYRNSLGPTDARILPEQWEELRSYVRESIDKIIQEKGSFRSPGGILVFKITNKKEQHVLDLINTYTERHTTRLRKLAQNPLPSAPRSRSVIEFPLKLSDEENKRFSRVCRAAGYNGLHIGLTPFHGAKAEEIQKTLAIPNEHDLPVLATHGTSLKAALRTKLLYQHFLKQDLEVLKNIDPTCKTIVNYDLFAGLWVPLQRTHDQTLIQNMFVMQQTLGINKGNMTSVARHIISCVGKTYKNSGYTVYFEIPATHGFSLYPQIDDHTLAQITQYIDQYCPGAKLCVDTGHIMTWLVQTPESRRHDELERIKSTLIRFRTYIGMVHVSSAGCWHDEFIKLYTAVHGPSPLWHITGLDTMLPVDESEQLDIIRALRATTAPDEKLIEVCESRYLGASVLDYFKAIEYNFSSKDNYYVELLLQGTLLGYRAISEQKYD